MASSGDSVVGSTRQPFDRLPTSVIPSLYDITIKSDLNSFLFTGSERVTVKIIEAVDRIVLNVDDVAIERAVYIADGSETNGRVVIDTEAEIAIIFFQQNIHPGSGILTLWFNGKIRDDMKGFYRCKYTNSETGEEKFSACTQFASTYARKAFPCWDEPAIKAHFRLTIIVPKDMVALSNTNIVSENPFKDDPSLKVVQFAETPRMSTYLLAYLFGEYDYLETKTNTGVSIKVFTPIGKKEQGMFSLRMAERSLEFYEQYFNVPYPLEKLDHIGVSDFLYAAMENWGLILYRESRFLFDPENSSNITKIDIATVVAHETAHQWFGNLVTMEWWTHLWLNEGFASFMQYLATDRIHPEFDIWSEFVSRLSMEAFRLDSLHNTHSIEIPVGHPSEVESIFDAISYNKGAAIIRMCHSWIGDEAFRQGMYSYLTKFAYKNAVTEDLWRELEEISKKPVQKMMSTWTKQRGHPIVFVSARNDGNKRILTLSQERFTFDGLLDDEEKQMLWEIPISVVTPDDPGSPRVSTLMETKSMEIELDDLNSHDWVKINSNALGFYRVCYASDMVELIKPAIVEKRIGPVDRLQIISDLFAASMAGKTSTVDFLKTLSSYKQEEDYVTWAAIDTDFGKLSSLISYTKFQSKFAEFGLKLYAHIFGKLGFDSSSDDKHTDNLLRTIVLGRLVSLGDDNVIKEAKKRFVDHLNGKVMSPDLRENVYRAIAKFGSDEDFDKLFELYDKESLVEEKLRLARAAAAASQPARVQRLLDFSLSNKVRSQDFCGLILSTLCSEESANLAWEFYCKNVDEIRRRYGTHQTSAKMIEGLIRIFASEGKKNEIERFFSTNNFPGLESYILRGLESIKNNITWLSNQAELVGTFLMSI
ncbi:puromycin-sensitive aminopeptidase-like isoform X2 [Brevipalpus obovatus]|uniref:puromycin-sensitive aminopeptidase-like isoform X2 n=1 Tax=Brevipalpus obovatus TaxID=246614 RepID=UPI003D9DB301